MNEQKNEPSGSYSYLYYFLTVLKQANFFFSFSNYMIFHFLPYKDSDH